MDAAAGQSGLKVLLVAEEAAGARALRLLADRGQAPIAVLTGTAAVASLAEDLGVEPLAPDLVLAAGFADRVAALEADILLNVHSVLNPHPSVIAAPRLGSFNVHPGPLPRYAGFNAPSWAIADGERRYAVTLHHMAPEMDAGPIAYEAWFEIGPSDTGLRVATRCIAESLPLLKRLLDDAATGSVPSRPQDPEGWNFTWYDVPYGGRLPWEARARRVVDLVRAADYGPYPSPWGTFVTVIGGEEIEIVRVQATGEPTSAPPGAIGTPRGEAALVSAGDEWVLVERCRRGGETVAPSLALPEGGLCAPPEKPVLG